MNIIQKTALILCITTLLGLNCTSAMAAESNNPSAPSISETIKYVEAALVEVNKSDFSAAQLLLKSVSTDHSCPRHIPCGIAAQAR